VDSAVLGPGVKLAAVDSKSKAVNSARGMGMDCSDQAAVSAAAAAVILRGLPLPLLYVLRAKQPWYTPDSDGSKNLSWKRFTIDALIQQPCIHCCRIKCKFHHQKERHCPQLHEKLSGVWHYEGHSPVHYYLQQHRNCMLSNRRLTHRLMKLS
jgi:hypothetical protein